MAACWALASALRPVGPELGRGWRGRPPWPCRSSHHPLPAFAWEPGELRAVSSSQRGLLSHRPLRPLPLTVPLDAGVHAGHCRPRCPWRLSPAVGPAWSLRQAGHQKSLPPHVLTECPQKPSPAEPVSWSQGPKGRLASMSIPEQNQRGQEGTREAGRG